MLNRDAMVQLWQDHTSYEFELKDADLAVSTMTPDARVMHLPTMSGGMGRAALRAYYADVFIPAQPPDTTLDVAARSVGDNVLVDECVMTLTHDREIPHLLPGVPATGASIEVVFVVVVKFDDSLMCSETLYWDQAQVLRQVGVVPRNRLSLPDVSDVSRYLRDANNH
jgi:carboxymethylenebutenolidase